MCGKCAQALCRLNFMQASALCRRKPCAGSAFLQSMHAHIFSITIFRSGRLDQVGRSFVCHSAWAKTRELATNTLNLCAERCNNVKFLFFICAVHRACQSISSAGTCESSGVLSALITHGAGYSIPIGSCTCLGRSAPVGSCSCPPSSFPPESINLIDSCGLM